ncbi:hypothetical protein OPT61_g6190 [Boeremia exigua]|uniref:Uncharacterized protein n=1 Tax=Boeremia exigua TaxID=749465 RepID=A0ACC2I7L6_9PLEO|nr:hypothetical protein OPT61_g6190 [Boeremia exigua]
MAPNNPESDSRVHLPAKFLEIVASGIVDIAITMAWRPAASLLNVNAIESTGIMYSYSSEQQANCTLADRLVSMLSLQPSVSYMRDVHETALP